MLSVDHAATRCVHENREWWGYLSSLSSSSFLQPLETEIEGTEEPAPMYRLVLAGDAGAGKSSFLLRLTLNDFRGDIQTTLGGQSHQHIRYWWFFISDLRLLFSLFRSWLPNEEHACGWGEDQPADMGHGGPGEVNKREAIKSGRHLKMKWLYFL